MLPEEEEAIEEEEMVEEEMVEDQIVEEEEEVFAEEPEEEIVEEVIEEIIAEEEPEPEPEPEIIEEFEEVIEEPAPIVTKVERHRRRPVAVIEPEPEPTGIDWVWFETDPAANWNDESHPEETVPTYGNATTHGEDAWWDGAPTNTAHFEEDDE